MNELQTSTSICFNHCIKWLSIEHAQKHDYPIQLIYIYIYYNFVWVVWNFNSFSCVKHFDVHVTCNEFDAPLLIPIIIQFSNPILHLEFLYTPTRIPKSNSLCSRCVCVPRFARAPTRIRVPRVINGKQRTCTFGWIVNTHTQWSVFRLGSRIQWSRDRHQWLYVHQFEQAGILKSQLRLESIVRDTSRRVLCWRETVERKRERERRRREKV